MVIQQEERSADVVPGRPRGRSGRAVRRAAIGAAAVVAVLAGGYGLGVYTGLLDHTPSTNTSAGVTVPSKVGGLAAAAPAQDFAQQPAWQAKAVAAVGGVSVVGRQYGSAKDRKTIRVVAARTDLTGKLDMKWVVEKGTKVGRAQCTNKLKLTESTQAKARPTMLMCWRTSKTFSAYSVIIDFDHTPKADEAVKVIDDIWGKA